MNFDENTTNEDKKDQKSYILKNMEQMRDLFMNQFLDI